MFYDFKNIEDIIKNLKASGAIKPEAHDSSNLNNTVLCGVDCPICNNKGYIEFEENGYTLTKDCKCMAQRRALLRARKSGLSEILGEYTFKSYNTPDAATKNIKDRAIDYVKHGSGKWFYISGAPGSGKTHICTAICSALMKEGLNVKYVLWREMVQKLKASINEIEYDRLLDTLKYPTVLYIDDFMKGTITDADVNRAFEVINARYNMTSKRTIISSERDIKDIRAIDEAVGGRIFQRSKEYCFKTSGINWRN